MEFQSQAGVHMYAITKDGIYTANRNIGKIHCARINLVSMPIFYRTPEDGGQGNRQMCSSMNQKFSMLRLKNPDGILRTLPINKSAPFTSNSLKRMRRAQHHSLS